MEIQQILVSYLVQVFFSLFCLDFCQVKSFLAIYHIENTHLVFA